MQSLTMPMRLVVVLTTALLLLYPASAHRGLTTDWGASCGSEFGSLPAALQVPDVSISWALNRVASCQHQQTWLALDAPTPNFQLYVGIGVPQIERFSSLRARVAVLGPGLPPAPPQLPFIVPEGMGALVLDSMGDQSSCAHLENANMIQSTSVRNGRCRFFEPYTQSLSWVILDKNLTLVEPGRHYVVAFPQPARSGKLWISVSDWSMREDFRTQYMLPRAACSCAHSNSEFYEKGVTSTSEPSGELCMGMPMPEACRTETASLTAGGQWELAASCGAIVKLKHSDLQLQFLSLNISIDPNPNVAMRTRLQAVGRLSLNGTESASTVPYMAHLHGLNCDIRNGGAHWMHSLSLPYNQPSNELHLSGVTGEGGVFVNELVQPWRADRGASGSLPGARGQQFARPMSVVMHDMRSTANGSRLACCNLQWMDKAVASLSSPAMIVSQEVDFAYPSIDSWTHEAAMIANKGYGKFLQLFDILNGAWHPGCNVSSVAATTRNRRVGTITVTFTSTVSIDRSSDASARALELTSGNGLALLASAFSTVASVEGSSFALAAASNIQMPRVTHVRTGGRW